MINESNLLNRREAMKRAVLGAGVVAVGAMGASAMAAGVSGNPGNLLPPGASTLQELSNRLAKAPRRRDFKTVPMILTSPDQWDSGGCKNFCVNGHLAGNCRPVRKEL
ncbi:hypothetical protein AAE485_01885 [Acidithiobacillus ferriphilus]|uniref:hypothetical protein n=1 Tax=Acidithiobacillus ferriphilus TaxID=1689834 RepID=UPI00390C53C5